MLARKRGKSNVEAAKHHLKEYGWSYRSAAPVVGLTRKSGFVHLSRVLNGQRTSRSLLAKIMALPRRSK